jgi:hypothetical protein
LGRKKSGIARDAASGNPIWWAGGVFRVSAAGGLSGSREPAPILSFTSPNAIDPVETFTVFLLSVVAGARRFAHASLLRADVALQALLGMARFPGDDTIRNLFKRFGQGQCQRFFSGL